MPVPLTADEFLDLVRKSGVADEKRLDAHLAKARASLPSEPVKVAELLVQIGVLTNFQAENIREGKWKRFSIGKYKILERLGSGGFAQVYLCEHKLMRRRVAIKVLPVAKTKGSSALERFHREARVLGKLDHPNIVHFYDLDQDGDLHFIVLEYVDGSSLQEIVKKTGPLAVNRACYYIAQTALALQHASDHGMVHRDIKPSNILVDRAGVVKLLDLGLALGSDGENSQLTKMHEDGTLGTADYIAPEQVMDSHDVDIRADIYSLGATFYFMLTGWPPFDGLPIADKLMAHQMKQPRPITDYRGDVPASVLAIVGKMMAKSADQRYANPGDLADALAPFTQAAVAPPAVAEMPVLCPAASGDPESAITAARRASSGGVGKQAPSSPAVPTAAEAAHPFVSPTEAAVEEGTPWEPFDDDTDHTDAMVNTPAARGSNKASKTAKTSSSNRVYTVLLVLGFCVIPICLVSGAVGFFVVKDLIFPPKLNVEENKGPRKFEVSKDPNRQNAFRSIQAALKNAEIDSIIELWDETYDEKVVLDGSKGGRTNFTLQAAPGKDIVWKAGRNDPETPILRIIKAPDFKFKGAGIILDGTLDKARKINDLMMITSDCAGLVIEDVQFRDFGRDAILVMNATGAEEKPILLRRLWTFKNPAEKPRAAIYFDANPKVIPAKNSHITIDKSCKFNSHEPVDAIKFNPKLAVFGDNVRWPDK